MPTSDAIFRPFRQRYRQACFHLPFLIASMALLGPSLFQGQVPAFRDTLHFYFPLWSFIDQQPLSYQLLPQWNPLDACGVPLIAEPTTGAFYPLRIILLIPWLSIGHRIGFFLWMHLAIGYAAMYWACRDLKLSRHASVAAGLAYALSGPIYFQCYNPVFLVGAAWLPLAWLCFWRMGDTEHHRWPAAVGYSIAVSLMVVGGDAQLTYHLVLIGALACMILHLPRSPRGFLQHASWFAMATGTALLVSSVQVLPTYHWLQYSQRQSEPIDTYYFSTAPWHLVTYLFPNFFGSTTVPNTRWISLWPAEGMMWVPSLHIGVLGLLAMMTSAFPRELGTNRRLQRTLWIVFWISLLSSWGGYGLGWMASAMGLVSTDHGRVSDEFGSLQWVWVNTLPGYSSFRYPAKWLTITCLAAGLLVGFGFDRLIQFTLDRRWLRRAVVVGTIWLMAVVLLMLLPWLPDLMGQRTMVVPIDPLCGPVHPVAAIRMIFLSSIHPVLVIGFLLGVIAFRRRHWKVGLALSLLAFELTISAWLTTSFVSESALRSAVEHLGVEHLGDDIRMEMDPVLLQAAHRFGKFHLLDGRRNWEASITLVPRGLDEQRSRPRADDVGWEPFNAGMPANWRDSWQAVLVEGSKQLAENESIVCQWLAPDELEVRFQTDHPREILLPILQDGGWSLQMADDDNHSQESRIQPTSPLHSKARIPSGKGITKASYATPRLVLGAIISGIGISGLLIGCYIEQRRRNAEQAQPSCLAANR